MNEAACSGNEGSLVWPEQSEEQERRRVVVAHVAEKVDGGQTEKGLEFLSRSVDGGFGKQCSPQE